mgnify:FL=1
MAPQPLYPSLPDPATVAEVVAALPVGERTVRRWIAEGHLPAYRLGRKLLIRRADLEAATTRVSAA